MSRLPDPKHKTSGPSGKEHQDAFGLLLIALALSVCAIFFRWRSIQSCFGISAVWLLALLLTKEYLVQPDSFWGRLVRNGLEFVATLTAVTGFLYVLSTFIRHFPPDDIVDWGDRLNRLKAALDRTALASSAVLVLLISLYVVLIWKKRKTDSFSAIWKPFIGVQNSIKRVALVLTMIASFSFTAIHAHNDAGDGGPFQVLTEAQAKALDKYKDLAWRINLTLSAEIKVQVLNQIIQDLPGPDQAIVKKDFNLESSGLEVPPDYQSREFQGMVREKILCWAVFQPNPKPQWFSLREECIKNHTYPINPEVSSFYDLLNQSEQKRKASSFSTEKPVVPPRGTTVTHLLAAEAAVNNMSPVDPPAWSEGLGRDVLENFCSLSLSSDHIPFVKAMAPLIGELLNVVLDTISESASEEIQTEAVRLADELVKNPSTPLRTKIREVATRYIRHLQKWDVFRLRNAARNATAEEPILRDQIRRFEIDAAAATREQTAQADALHDAMQRMHVEESDLALFPSTGLERSLRHRNGNMEALLDQNERARNYDSAITTALAQHTINDAVAKQVLGEKYQDYKAKAIDFSKAGQTGHTTGEADEHDKPVEAPP